MNTTTLTVTDPLTDESFNIVVPENFGIESVVAEIRKSEPSGIDPLAGFSDLIFGEVDDHWELQWFDGETIYTIEVA